MTKSFTGEEFAKALTEDTIKEPIVKIGMVKKDENGPSAILFAEGTACANWIKIPVDLIQTVEHLMTTQCGDHKHPLVQIRFKEPPPDNEAARVFAELARSSLRRTMSGMNVAFDAPTLGFQEARRPTLNWNPFRVPRLPTENPEDVPHLCLGFCYLMDRLCVRYNGEGALCDSYLDDCRSTCYGKPILW